MSFTDDPIKDFIRHEAEQERRLQKLPQCSECGEHIQNDYAFYINDEWICNDCMEGYRREVEIDG